MSTPTQSSPRLRAAGAAALVGFALVVALAAMSGGRSSRRPPSTWYDRLNKPPFQPADWLFAPVWTVLYACIAVSGWRVFRQPPSTQRRRALRLWTAQLGLNGLWSWLFFGKRQTGLALVDSTLLLATTVAYARVARDVDSLASRLFVPYVGWVGFATLLNEEIVRRNPRPHAEARKASA